MTEVRVIGREQVRDLLPIAECIEVLDAVMRAMARGETIQPLRQVMELPGTAGVLSLMPGYIGTPRCFGVKAVSVFPANFGTRLPSHQGAVLLFEPENGSLVAVVEASQLTAIRTAAASAVATRTLANAGAGDLAILGYGDQAESHAAAMAAVRDIKRLRVWGRSPEKARAFASRMEDRHAIPGEVAPTVEEAVSGADIICTTTAAPRPILRGEWVSPGAHLNVVGSSVPSTAEIDTEAVRRSRFFVDYRESVLQQGGEFLNAMRSGAISESHILGEVGEVLVGRKSGRLTHNDITIFKSLGMPAEDLSSSQYIYDRATRNNIGAIVDF